METFRPIPKGPVMKSILIYEQLKERLMRGQLTFGEKISITDFIDEFKVSRRPVMDAMKMLESEGFIEIIPQSGCKVIDYQRKVVLDQFLLTSTLEQLSAELAATNYTYSEMEALESFHRHIKSNKQNLLDKFFFFKYNRELHFRILSMAHSAKISKFAMQMMDLNDFFLLNLFTHFKFDVLELVNYHSEIINAIKARNEVKAKKITEEHTNYINYLKKDLPFEVAMV